MTFYQVTLNVTYDMISYPSAEFKEENKETKQ